MQDKVVCSVLRKLPFCRSQDRTSFSLVLSCSRLWSRLIDHFSVHRYLIRLIEAILLFVTENSSVQIWSYCPL